MRDNEVLGVHIEHPSNDGAVLMDMKGVVIGEIAGIERCIGSLADTAFAGCTEVSNPVFVLQEIKKEQIAVLGMRLHGGLFVFISQVHLLVVRDHFLRIELHGGYTQLPVDQRVACFHHRDHIAGVQFSPQEVF